MKTTQPQAVLTDYERETLRIRHSRGRSRYFEAPDGSLWPATRCDVPALLLPLRGSGVIFPP